MLPTDIVINSLFLNKRFRDSETFLFFIGMAVNEPFFTLCGTLNLCAAVLP